MSLISDALKKARQEAARQDSLRPGLPYAIGAATAPAPRAPWISLLAGLGAGCLLAAAIFAMAFFGGWGPFHKPAPQTQVAAAPAPQPVTAPPSQAALPEPPPKPVAVVEAPAPKPPEPPKREPEAVRPAPQPQTPVVIAPHPAPEAAPATPPVTAAPVSQPAAEAPAPAPAPVQAAPAPSAPEGGLVEGSTYSGELPVPGGGSVKLNGIVYSPDHPIAVLDGRVMGPGENVQGFTVVAIESGRVKLQGHGATVYLAPK